MKVVEEISGELSCLSLRAPNQIQAPEKRQVSPISLNSLIEEGMRHYNRSQNPPLRIDCHFSHNLYRTVGDPEQMRFLFRRLLNCASQASAIALPDVRFATGNLIISALKAKQYSSQNLLKQGWYVSLTMSLQGVHSIPRFGPYRSAIPFERIQFGDAWHQIQHIVCINRGGLRTRRVERPTTALEIVLPALMPLQ